MSQWVNNINDTIDAPPQVGYMLGNQYPMDPHSHQDSVNRETERRGSFMGSTFGGNASKSQSMTSLTSRSHRQPRKESMPASIGGGGRFISPGDSPFDAMLKGTEGLGSRRGSQISMHSDRSMSMKW